jgi:hypothetical protein
MANSESTTPEKRVRVRTSIVVLRGEGVRVGVYHEKIFLATIRFDLSQRPHQTILIAIRLSSSCIFTFEINKDGIGCVLATTIE